MKLLRWGMAVIALSVHVFAQAKDWKGAELITHDEFKYGAFEARIRAAEGSGMATAFFLWKHDSELEGTEWQEQDFEIFGKNGRYQTQIMTPGDPRTPHSEVRQLATPAWENYYTYRMEWTPDYLAFYVDGHLVRKEDDRNAFAKLLDPARAEPAQLRMSLWAGDWDWSGAFDPTAAPAYSYVEFIEVFDFTPGTGPNGSDFSPRWRDDFNFMDTSKWWFANWTFEYAVNDYTRNNATTLDGKLVLALTSNNMSGKFPTSAPADNPPLPPIEDIPSPQPEAYLPVSIPGRVEAEQVLAYEDSSIGNEGDEICGEYYFDAQTTNDLGGGCHLAWTTAGEWTEYQIDVPATGIYDVSLRAATSRADVSLHVEIDGVDVTGPISIVQSDWQNFGDYTRHLELTEGLRTVRVVFDTGNVNLNYLDFSDGSGPVDPVDPDPSDPGPVNPGSGPGSVVELPARIEAESFTEALDNTPGNQGDGSCETGDVDSEATNDIDGLCHLAWTETGEWVAYEVSVLETAEFDLSLRISTGRTDKSFHIEVNGVDVSGPVAVPYSGWGSFNNFVVPVSLEAGQHTVKLVFDTGWLNVNYLEFTRSTPDLDPVDPDPVDPDPVDPSTGSGSRVAIPARIEAEDFTAAVDNTAGDQGDTHCETGDVDSELTPDSDGLCHIAWTEAGEWLAYDIDVPADGNFDLSVRASTGRWDTAFHIEVDGVDVSGPVAVPYSGWSNYGDFMVPLALSAGEHTVKLVFETGWLNVNYLEFSHGSGVTDPVDPVDPDPVDPDPVDPAAAVVVPARIEAENFIDAYDLSPGNNGDAACNTGDVDAQITADGGGGCNLAWTEAGEWVEYQINVPADGAFELTLRAATSKANVLAYIEIDGVDVTGDIAIMASSWQDFQNYSLPVNLLAGDHSVRLVFSTGNLNVNYLEFTAVDPVDPVDPSCEIPVSVYGSSAMTATAGGLGSDGGWNLWSNGSLSVAHTFTGNDALVTVYARGDLAGSELPHMILRVGGEIMGDLGVDMTDYFPYEFTVPVTGAGEQSISIEFDNDYYQSGSDRNLRIYEIHVDECL